jgi:hypothetical protein
MNNLSRRVDRIEGQLEADKGACLRWPNGDGTFTEVPGCRSLNDPEIALGVAGRGAGRIGERLTDDADRIRHNPTK